MHFQCIAQQQGGATADGRQKGDIPVLALMLPLQGASYVPAHYSNKKKGGKDWVHEKLIF